MEWIIRVVRKLEQNVREKRSFGEFEDFQKQQEVSVSKVLAEKYSKEIVDKVEGKNIKPKFIFVEKCWTMIFESLKYKYKYKISKSEKMKFSYFENFNLENPFRK